MFTWRASPRLCVVVSSHPVFANKKRLTLDSAFGFSSCAADMLQDVYQGIEQYKKESKVTAWGIAASRAWPSASPLRFWKRGHGRFSAPPCTDASHFQLRTFLAEELSLHDHTPDYVSRHHIATKFKHREYHDVGRLPPSREPYRLCGMSSSLELHGWIMLLMRCAGFQGDLAARHHWQPPCRSPEGRAGSR